MIRPVHRTLTAIGAKAAACWLALVLPLSLLAFPTIEPFADASANGGTTYAVGQNLAGQTNSSGERWFSVNTASSAAPLTLTNFTLPYSAFAPPSGNAVALRNLNGPGARLFLASDPSNFFFNTTNATLYYSLLLQAKSIATLTTAGVYNVGFSIVGLGDQVGQGNIQGARLNLRKVGADTFQVGIAKNSATVAYAPTLYTTNDVLFIVAEYEIVFNESAPSSVDDNVRLWVNPSPVTFGATTQPTENASILGSTPDAGTITSFAILQRSIVSPDLLILDELRVGTNWGFVTGGAADVYIVPPHTNLSFGATLKLDAVINGPSLLTAGIQWQRNGTNLVNDGRIFGATTTNLTILNVTAFDAGTYSVIAFTATNSVTNFATVTVQDPGIISPPTGVAYSAGSTIQLSVTAGGTPPLTYQWQYNGTNLTDSGHISGVTSNFLLINSIQAADSGLYTVVVTGPGGSITSPPAALISFDIPEPLAGAPLSSGEYFWDSDPGQGNGTAVSLPAGETAIFGDGSTPAINASIGSLPIGVHRLGFRTKDTDDRWGDITWVPVELKDPAAVIAEVTVWPPPETNQWLASAEYFWDVDPGEGLGVATNFPAGETLTMGNANSPPLFPDLSQLNIGIHRLGFRVRDASGRWAPATWVPLEVKDSSFLIAEVSEWPPLETSRWLVTAEYFWDTDPGTNNGAAISFAAGETYTPDASFGPSLNLPIPQLPLGNHRLGFRVRDARGIWTETEWIGVVLDRKTDFNLASAVTILTSTNTGSYPISSISCPGPGQTCSNTFDLAVQTASLLTVQYTAHPSACADVRIHFFVDGIERAVSSQLAAGAASGWFELGPVAPGGHLLQLQAEGFAGGCNVGTLTTWAGSLQVVTTSLSTNVAGGEFTHLVNPASGLAVADFNGDGYADVFQTLADQSSALFVNDKHGSLNRSNLPPSLDVTNGQAAAWSDFDNDGWLDLLVATDRSLAPRNLLYHNLGGTNFALLATTNLPSAESNSCAVAWADVDNDGFVDFVIGRTNGTQLELYRNLGDGAFANHSESSNLLSGSVRALAFGDLDNDGRQDLISVGAGGVHLFRNFGTNQLFELNGTGLANDVTATSASWVDYDCDGWLDVFIASSDHLGALYHNNHDSTFAQVQLGTFNVPGFSAASCAWEDFDQDGRLDLFVASATTNFASRLFHNHPNTLFDWMTNNAPQLPPGVYAGSAWADLNRDGRPDLLVAARDGTNVLAQSAGSGAGWLRLKLSGRPSNRAASGAKVKVLAHIDGISFWQTREISGGNGNQNESPLTFGLGDATNVNSLVIEWPSGLETIYTNLALNQALSITELPEGQPVITVNETFQASGQYSFVSLDPVTVTIDSPFQNGWVFFTTDGTEPDFTANWYTEPFEISPPATIRAIAYDESLTVQAFGEPAALILVPTFFLTNSTPGGGDFTLFPPGPNYLSNTVVTAVATSLPGWTFMNWTGGISGTNPTNTFVMDSDKDVKAVFGTSLSLTALGGAAFGTVSNSPSVSLHPYGSFPRLTALSAPGKYFVRWTLSGSSATNLTSNPMDWRMTNAEPSFIGLFANLPTNTFSLTVLKNGNGDVARNPQAAFYTNGTQVTLTATPVFGEFFLGWSGDVTSPQNPVTVTMNSSKLVTANFGLLPPLFSFGSPIYTVNENAGFVAVNVRNNGVPGTVDFATVNGTAMGGNGVSGDYVSTNGTISFAYGETNKTILIGIRDNYLIAPDKSFQVLLSNPTGGATSLTNPSTTAVVIHYNDAVTTNGSLLVQSFPAPVPDRSGSLRVTITPALPPVDGGFWRFPWELAWRPAGQWVTNLVQDVYDVEFRQLGGFTIPAVPAQLVLSNAPPTDLTNHYFATGPGGVGSLTVQIGPNNPVVVTNAGWRVLGESSWRPPGSTATNQAPGTQIVEFKPVTGLAAPAAREVLVFANQGNVISAYYELPAALPPNSILPNPLGSLAQMNNSPADVPRLPYTFNGQLQSDAGFGSGIATRAHTVLTAAHVVFNDQSLSYVNELAWFFQHQTGELETKPQPARGWYVLAGYAAARTNDLPPVGSLAPGVSSPASRNADVAAVYFVSPAARGGFSGFLASDAATNEWLTSAQPKMLLGYPLDGTPFGYPNIVSGKFHSTVISNYSFALQSGRVYSTPELLSFPGNSGGPLCVLGTNGVFYPAGVYLGTVGSASVVRAIDGDVANLINLAEAAAVFGDEGTNFTGGGVIRVVTSSLGGGTLGYLTVHLGPPAALTAGGGCRIAGGTNGFSSSPDFTVPVATQTTFTLEFSDPAGWNSPPSRTVTVAPGQVAEITASYNVLPPEMVMNRTAGLGLTGTTNTRYRIEYRTNLTTGAWLPLRTNTLNAGFNLLMPWPPTNGPSAFYRAVWLP